MIEEGDMNEDEHEIFEEEVLPAQTYLEKYLEYLDMEQTHYQDLDYIIKEDWIEELKQSTKPIDSSKYNEKMDDIDKYNVELDNRIEKLNSVIKTMKEKIDTMNDVKEVLSLYAEALNKNKVGKFGLEGMLKKGIRKGTYNTEIERLDRNSRKVVKGIVRQPYSEKSNVNGGRTRKNRKHRK